MDGAPGLIHSGDDFGVNAAGIIITETTISGFSGFDPNGIPEFVRARKAMQYSASIDDYARIMKEGNNGGYANNWLVADRKTNEIASLELGLKNVIAAADEGRLLRRLELPGGSQARQGRDRFRPERQEPQPERAARPLAAADGAEQGQDRRRRGPAFPGRPRRHASTAGRRPSERTLVRPHRSVARAGWGRGRPPYAPAGAVQNKITDAAGAEKMTFHAALGHACGDQLQSVGASREAQRIRLDARHPARHARARLGEVLGEVAARSHKLADPSRSGGSPAGSLSQCLGHPIRDCLRARRHNSRRIASR